MEVIKQPIPITLVTSAPQNLKSTPSDFDVDAADAAFAFSFAAAAAFVSAFAAAAFAALFPDILFDRI
jgi:hypothetical protein